MLPQSDQGGGVIIDMFEHVEQADEVVTLRQVQPVGQMPCTDIGAAIRGSRQRAGRFVHFHSRNVAEHGQHCEITAGAGPKFEDFGAGLEFQPADRRRKHGPTAAKPPVPRLDLSI
jgi:hypothetical protein